MKECSYQLYVMGAVTESHLFPRGSFFFDTLTTETPSANIVRNRENVRLFPLAKNPTYPCAQSLSINVPVLVDRYRF